MAMEVETTFGKWIVLPIIVLNYGLSVGLPVSLTVMFLDWQETFQVSRAQTAAVHSTCVGFLFGAGLIPGYIMNKIGARITMLLGAGLTSIGFLLSMFATSIPFLIVTVGITAGLGFSCIMVPTMSSIVIIFDKYRGLAISAGSTCSGLMSVVFPNIFSPLLQHNSWRGVFGILACVVLNTSVFSIVITSVTKSKSTLSSRLDPDDDDRSMTMDPNEITGVRDDVVPNECGKVCEEIDIQVNAPEELRADTFSSQRCWNRILNWMQHSDWRFLVDPVFVLFLCQNVTSFVFIFCFPFLIMDFSKTRGFEKSTGVYFLTTLFTCSIVGRFLVGLLNLSPYLHSIHLTVVFSTFNMVIMIVLIFVEDYVVMFICMCCFGICHGSVIAMHPKCVADIEAVDLKSFPLALGLSCTSEGIADLIMPILIGYSVDTTGDYTVILAVMGCVGLVVLSMLAAGFRHSTKKRKARDTNHLKG